MRRGCFVHLQKENYMVGADLDAAEVLVCPLFGVQSHSAYRREASRTWTIGGYCQSNRITTKEKGSISSSESSQGKPGFNANNFNISLDKS